MTPPPPIAVGKGLYVMKFDHWLRMLFVEGKFEDIFQGGGDIMLGMGFLRVNIPREILH